MSPDRPRILLLLPSTTYKAEDFLTAARELNVDVTVGSERKQALEHLAPGETLTLDLARPERTLQRIVDADAERPFRAVLAADDEAAVTAAVAGAALGLPHNPAEAVRASRDKFESRTRFEAAGLSVPRFRKHPIDANPGKIAQDTVFPCVVKPLHLSASQGVLRADDPADLERAWARVASIVRTAGRGKAGDADHLLVEEYLPGDEVAVEGVLHRGALHVLALLDKPDPLEGPVFEETLFVTPSRLPTELQQAVRDETERACQALGLAEGPVHAELRLGKDRPWVLEVAARTIGGLCARLMRYGTGVSLEEIVLRHALGQRPEPSWEGHAAGVMMIPIPGRGVLREVQGIDEARRVAGVQEVTLTLHAGAEVVPLPEGNRYLGFIFAHAGHAAEVERALREAHRLLRIRIDSVASGPG